MSEIHYNALKLCIAWNSAYTIFNSIRYMSFHPCRPIHNLRTEVVYVFDSGNYLSGVLETFSLHRGEAKSNRSGDAEAKTKGTDRRLLTGGRGIRKGENPLTGSTFCRGSLLLRLEKHLSMCWSDPWFIVSATRCDCHETACMFFSPQ